MTDSLSKPQQNLIPSVIFGLLFAATLLFSVGVFEGWWLQSQTSNAVGLIFVLLVLAVVALIFLIAVIALTIINIKQKTTFWPYVCLWAPAFLVLIGLGMLQHFKEFKQESFEQNHPNISELHVNLSSKYLWLATNGYDAQPIGRDQFLENTRYASDGLENMAEYAGSRLASSFKNMSLYASDTEALEAKTVLTLPVIQPSQYPDVASFFKLVEADSLVSYKPTEAGLWVYQYYYYDDHIDAVPAINLSGSASMALWGSNLPVVAIHIVNLQAKSLARVEVDGATLALGNSPLPPENDPNACNHRNYTSYIINQFNAPIKVRWQFAEANPQWYEAVVTLPKLNSPKAKPDWSKREDNVFLYFQKNAAVAAQWQQVVTFKDDKLGIRTTAIEPALIEPAPCGNAADSWDETVVRVAK